MRPRNDIDVDSMDVGTLLSTYANRTLTPADVVERVLQQCAENGDDGVWITRLEAAIVRRRAQEFSALLADDDSALKRLPLLGIPFAVKDNIDVADMPTTAACPAFAYEASTDATVVAKLQRAGAILIGKTNLDQFATGLVGIRSPYGVPKNPFNAEYLPGGSSSGSAVAVARGMVSFALGTDTAGSGRIPAALNNLVGWKPTRGVFSNRGVVPACPSLDCVSIFARNVVDAARVANVMVGFDVADPFSLAAAASQRYVVSSPPKRWRVAVPRDEQLEFFGDTENAQQYRDVLATIEQSGGEIVAIDFTPFRAAAELLYQGPWIAERSLVMASLLARDPEAIHPEVRRAVSGADNISGRDVFAGLHRLLALRRQVVQQLSAVDCLVVPSFARAYRVSEALAAHQEINKNLGYYTNFVNLLDLCAIAVPTGVLSSQLPTGVTLIGLPFTENKLAAVGAMLQSFREGATITPHSTSKSDWSAANDDSITLCVSGAHMSGLPLNHQLLTAGANLLASVRTAPHYKLFALTHMQPPRPGVVRVADNEGVPIVSELWSVPKTTFGAFVAAIPTPLAIGKVELESGEWVTGFVCQSYALAGATDISDVANWRKYCTSAPKPVS